MGKKSTKAVKDSEISEEISLESDDQKGTLL